MNDDIRFDRRLPTILAELGAGPFPDYTDTLLARTAASRQRPGWAFAERWLPMSVITRRAVTVPRLSMRAVIVVALLTLAVVAAALFAGSQPRRLPAPFGPAANGVISYVSDGDLYAGDPATGRTSLLVGGPEQDSGPGFSPDGSQIAFWRESGAETLLMVANADGSDPYSIATYPTDRLPWANWAPDSRNLAVIRETAAGARQLDLVGASRGGATRTIATVPSMDYVQFRPPDGREILFRAEAAGTDGLYVMNADGSDIRPLVERPGGVFWAGWAVYAPDGSRIYFTRDFESPSPTGTCCDLWVMDADGGNPHQLVPNDGTSWNGIPVVSPDGSRVAYWGTANDDRLAVVPADGSGPTIQTGPPLTGGADWWAWAPDSSSILVVPTQGSGRAYLLDPSGGPWTTLPWATDGDLDWQRIAN